MTACMWPMSHRNTCPRCNCVCALTKGHKGRHQCANDIAATAAELQTLEGEQ